MIPVMASVDSPTPERNPYTPPMADVRDVTAPDAQGFYVVSSRKFFLLYVLTFSIYGVYWFYRHWAQVKLERRADLWPIPRAIFSIFFTHELARRIDARLRERGDPYAWSPGAIATLVVVLQLVNGLLDRLAWKGIGSPVTDFLSLLLLFPLAFAIHAMQRAANTACGDREGGGNSGITPANIVWLLLGGLWWLLVIAGLLLPTEPV
jgi:hypothetical protein